MEEGVFQLLQLKILTTNAFSKLSFVSRIFNHLPISPFLQNAEPFVRLGKEPRQSPPLPCNSSTGARVVQEAANVIISLFCINPSCGPPRFSHPHNFLSSKSMHLIPGHLSQSCSPPCCSSHAPGTLEPQGLCTGSSFYL